jgi:hypothetical protein
MAVPTYKVELVNSSGSTRKDVTAYVRSVNITRGRSRELDKFEAGTFSVTFDNRKRYFDPLYTSSPFNNYIVPKQYIVITSGNYIQFAGFIEDWNLTYDISGDSVSIASGADAFAYLAQRTLPAGVQTSQLSSARVDALLTTDILPFNTTKYIFTGKRTLQADTIAAGTNALEYLQLVERTEGGFFYVNRNGVITFVGVSAPVYSMITFRDDGGTYYTDFAFQGIEITYGSELLYNEIYITRLGGVQVTATDTTSVSRYDKITFSDEGLLFNNDTDALNRAKYLVAKYGLPEYRVDSVTLSLAALNASKQNTLLELDIGVIVRVTFTPNGISAVGTDIVDKQVRIIGIDHQMNVDDHVVTYRFQSLDRESFTLDDPSLGLLDFNLLGF